MKPSTQQSDADYDTQVPLLKLIAHQARNYVDNVRQLVRRCFGNEVDLSENPFDIVGTPKFFDVCRKDDLTEADVYGRTYPMLATDACETVYVETMIQFNKTININQKDNQGWTLLTHALHMVENNQIPEHRRIGKNSDILKSFLNFLCIHHADPDLPDNNGMTPRDHAKELGISENFLPPPKENITKVSHHDSISVLTNIPPQNNKCE